MKVMATKFLISAVIQRKHFHSSSAKLISHNFMESSVCLYEDLIAKWLFYRNRKCSVLKHGKSCLTVTSQFSFDGIWILSEFAAVDILILWLMSCLTFLCQIYPGSVELMQVIEDFIHIIGMGMMDFQNSYLMTGNVGKKQKFLLSNL